MLKVSYERLTFEIDKLYSKKFAPHDIKGIQDHCEYIAQFIESCGWNVQEYMETYVRKGLEELFPSSKNSN